MTLQRKLEGKRFGVVLSAGYFGFYGHTGFVEGVLEAGLTPSAWAGTSAGGMVGAFAASGLPIDALKDMVLSQRREHFWDPDPLGMAIDALRRGHRASGLLRGRRFRALLERHLPHPTFERLPTPLVLVATNLTTRGPEVIDSGELASAVHATCAYPGLFQAVRRGRSLLWDGGIIDKTPVLALKDAPAGRKLEALLVHYLPTRETEVEPRGPLAWASGLSAGFDALRREHFRLQLEVLAGRGVPVYIVTSNLPPVTPRTMHEGVRALEAGLRSAREGLARAAVLREPVAG